MLTPPLSALVQRRQLHPSIARTLDLHAPAIESVGQEAVAVFRGEAFLEFGPEQLGRLRKVANPSAKLLH